VRDVVGGPLPGKNLQVIGAWRIERNCYFVGNIDADRNVEEALKI
jgi:hypothetical protein